MGAAVSVFSSMRREGSDSHDDGSCVAISSPLLALERLREAYRASITDVTHNTRNDVVSKGGTETKGILLEVYNNSIHDWL